jgi:hypothetical protein
VRTNHPDLKAAAKKGQASLRCAQAKTERGAALLGGKAGRREAPGTGFPSPDPLDLHDLGSPSRLSCPTSWNSDSPRADVEQLREVPGASLSRRIGPSPTNCPRGPGPRLPLTPNQSIDTTFLGTTELGPGTHSRPPDTRSADGMPLANYGYLARGCQGPPPARAAPTQHLLDKPGLCTARWNCKPRLP